MYKVRRRCSIGGIGRIRRIVDNCQLSMYISIAMVDELLNTTTELSGNIAGILD